MGRPVRDNQGQLQYTTENPNPDGLTSTMHRQRFNQDLSPAQLQQIEDARALALARQQQERYKHINRKSLQRNRQRPANGVSGVRVK